MPFALQELFDLVNVPLLLFMYYGLNIERDSGLSVQISHKHEAPNTWYINHVAACHDRLSVLF
jgi:hypothetical protein